VESGELQAQLHGWLPWQDPVTVVHVTLLNWSVDPLSDGGELELLLLISLVERKGEVLPVEESQGLSSLVPDESLGLISRVEWLSDDFNLFFIVLNRHGLSEGVLWTMLSSNYDHSTVKSINVLNWWHTLNWNWVTSSLGGFQVGSLLGSFGFSGSFLGSLLLLSLLRFSWSQVLVLVFFMVSLLMSLLVRLDLLVVMSWLGIVVFHGIIITLSCLSD